MRASSSAIYSELAASYDVLLYPFFLDGVAADAKLNQRDGLHPNAAGVDAHRRAHPAESGGAGGARARGKRGVATHQRASGLACRAARSHEVTSADSRCASTVAMPRLFTGLEIPADVGQSLSMLRGGLPGARWIDPENYHRHAALHRRRRRRGRA